MERVSQTSTGLDQALSAALVLCVERRGHQFSGVILKISPFWMKLLEMILRIMAIPIISAGLASKDTILEEYLSPPVFLNSFHF